MYCGTVCNVVCGVCDTGPWRVMWALHVTCVEESFKDVVVFDFGVGVTERNRTLYSVLLLVYMHDMDVLHTPQYACMYVCTYAW